MAGAGNTANTVAPMGKSASPVGSSVWETSSNLYNQAAGGPNIGQFMNPATQAVTGQTMQDLERQRQMAINTTGAQASAAGAFGGSRHGVAEALTNQGFADTGAQTFAGLNQDNFNTALGAAQNQQGIQSGLSSQGFGFGQSISDQQATQGGQQQMLTQALIDAASNQYSGYTSSPMDSLTAPLAALGAANMGQSTTTQQQNPGLLNILSMGMGLL